MAAPAANPDPKFRVKVYELNEEGEWSDKGTGHVQFQRVQSMEAAYMFVHSEHDSSLLLESKVIMDDDVYQRQGDTIISWNEPFSRQDLALSFAESGGCQEVWEKLCSVRGVDPATAGVVVEDEPNQPSANYVLPPVQAGLLDAVLEFLTDLSPFMREGVANAMVEKGYVGQLVAHFKALEQEKNTAQLQILFQVVRAMVMMNETFLLEQLLNNDVYESVFGILEYDPDLAANKPKHREFLSNAAKFKQVVPFNDEALVNRIHQNFRVQYLKDVVLPRAMDDATFGTLNSIIFFNSIEIVQQLQANTNFLSQVFHKLTNVNSNPNVTAAQQEQKDLLTLLQEMCNLSKNLQLDSRNSFFKVLNEHGVMGVFEHGLQHPDLACRVSAFDILTACVNHDPSVVRVFMLDQEPNFGLLDQLIKRILEDPDQGVKGHASEILRQLLDPESMDQSQEKNQFLNTFYEKFLEQMIKVFSPDAASEYKCSTRDLNVGRNHVCELLTFFVQSHGYRIKYFVLRNNIVGKVCELMKEREKYVALSAVKFVRACVGLKDEFYFRYMIKNNSFAPIVQLFVRTREKNNLLNSAIIELFDFIRKENIKSLITYIVDKFKVELENIKYVDTFRGLWTQHGKNQEAAAMAPPTIDANVLLGEQDAEDVYFATEDDDEADTKPAKDNDAEFTDATSSTPSVVPYPQDTNTSSTTDSSAQQHTTTKPP